MRVKKLLLLLPLLALTLLFSPTAQADDRRYKRDRNDGYDRSYNSQRRGKRNLNDGYDRAYNRNRGFERRGYQGRSRYYRDGRYYYRGRDGYYPYGSRRGDGGISIRF